MNYELELGIGIGIVGFHCMDFHRWEKIVIVRVFIVGDIIIARIFIPWAVPRAEMRCAFSALVREKVILLTPSNFV